MKGQLLFRQVGSSSGRSTSFAGIGIMENTGGAIERERYQDFLLFDDAINLTGESRPLDPEYAAADMDSILRTQGFQSPSEVSGYGGGSIIFRKSNAPAEVFPNGADLFVLAMRCSSAEFGHRTIYEISSDNHGRLAFAPSHEIGIEPNGMALSQVHRSTIWGWASEKWGPVSTMRLDIARQCQECVELLIAGKPFPENIPADIRSIVDPSHRDQDFIQYRNEMHRRKAIRPWTEWLSESQSAEIEKQGSEVIKELLAKTA